MIRDRPIVLLASRSPRRRGLLAGIGIAYEPLDVAVDESPLAGESPSACVERLARDKASAGRVLRPDGHLVLAADTTVTIDGAMLGKPDGEAAALDMLARLSGRTHEVYSGVALLHAGGIDSLAVRTRVSFRATTAAERSAYWASGEPAGKAGAYAIQGLGAVFVERIEGSYSNVVGLPLFETARLLAVAGVDPLASR